MDNPKKTPPPPLIIPQADPTEQPAAPKTPEPSPGLKRRSGTINPAMLSPFASSPDSPSKRPKRRHRANTLPNLKIDAQAARELLEGERSDLSSYASSLRSDVGEELENELELAKKNGLFFDLDSTQWKAGDSSISGHTPMRKFQSIDGEKSGFFKVLEDAGAIREVLGPRIINAVGTLLGATRPLAVEPVFARTCDPETKKYTYGIFSPELKNAKEYKDIFPPSADPRAPTEEQKKAKEQLRELLSAKLAEFLIGATDRESNGNDLYTPEGWHGLDYEQIFYQVSGYKGSRCNVAGNPSGDRSTAQEGKPLYPRHVMEMIDANRDFFNDENYEKIQGGLDLHPIRKILEHVPSVYYRLAAEHSPTDRDDRIEITLRKAQETENTLSFLENHKQRLPKIVAQALSFPEQHRADEQAGPSAQSADPKGALGRSAPLPWHGRR